MNSNIIIKSAIRFVLLFVFQVFILKAIALGWWGHVYLHVILYPLFIILLPLRTPRALALVLAFFLGLGVDIFYDSPGLHASATVFIAFVRPILLNFLEPREGYNVNYSPTIARMGFQWFWRYAAIMLLLHLFFYFCVLDFSASLMLDILLKTIFSFIISFAFLLMVVFIFKPVD